MTLRELAIKICEGVVADDYFTDGNVAFVEDEVGKFILEKAMESPAHALFKTSVENLAMRPEEYAVFLDAGRAAMLAARMLATMWAEKARDQEREYLRSKGQVDG